MSTMCFDIRRVDDDHVCIYRAGHNAFGYAYHLPESSWNNLLDEDNTKYYRYQYIIVGKDMGYGGIERIMFSTCDRNHAYDVLSEYEKGTGYLHHENVTEYRLIRFPIYRNVYFTKDHKRYTMFGDKKFYFHRQESNILHDSVKLYCPVGLNRKHRVYWEYSDRRKPKGGCYGHGPRRIKGKESKDVQTEKHN